MTHRLRLLFIALMLFPLTSVSAQVLKGRITDSSGHPLSYASVYIKELRQGTATNQEGEYELRLPAGLFTVNYQYLGYMPVMERITMSNTEVTRDIILTEQVFMIPEVRISASGKDPAYFIMRKAIGMAPFHLNQVRKYKAEVYIKGGGKIDKLPKMIQRQMKADVNDVQLKEGQYYFTESVNIITFTAPDKYVHQVVSSRSNIPAGSSETSPMDYIEASFYQPVLLEMAISPLAPNAFSHYNFKFLGATVQGDYIIDKIQVTPKRKSQQVFEGFIFIVEDQWSIHSLDFTNENMAGTVRVKQLYTPVESGIWMPVSHEFLMQISIIGIRANASYTSAVKYLEVEPDKTATPPEGYFNPVTEPVADETKTERQKKIEEIFAKSELTAHDMAKLSRLNEKSAEEKTGKDSLEIKEKTTYIINEDAGRKDSAYWEEIRPIPLTGEELSSIVLLNKEPSNTLATRDSTTLTISIGTKPAGESRKHPSVLKPVFLGKRWQLSKNNSAYFDGLLSTKYISFNTVDGFILGTGFGLSTKTGEKGRFSLFPSVRYGFSRKDLMWNATANMSYDPMKAASFFVSAGEGSKEFSASGVNPLINSLSSLLFRENWMKLYKQTSVTIGHRGDIANGLNLVISGTWEKREVLDNTTDFSIFRPEKDYTSNLPDNPFVKGDIEGYDPLIAVNHHNVSFNADLNIVPGNHYRIVKGSKINMGSDYPSVKLSWKHGFNYNNTLSGHFDMLKAEVYQHKYYGALTEFSWRVLGGGFLHNRNLQLQDHYFFNTQKTPVLLNNYSDAFYLKQYYNISSPDYFAEAHVSYTNPYLLIKRLPGISKTLMRENLSLSMLWTPDYGVYTEVGYAISEIFLLAKAGVYTGFRNTSFDGIGFRLSLRLN